MEKSVTKIAVPTVLLLRCVMPSMALVRMDVRRLEIWRMMTGGLVRDVIFIYVSIQSFSMPWYG